MQQFRYKAVTTDGKKIQGTVEAKDEENAVNILREKKLIITFLKDESKSLKNRLLISIFKTNSNDVIDFTRQLATMVNSGLPIISSLQLLRKKSRPVMANVLDNVIGSIEAGDSLYKAMSKHPRVFSKVYLALIRAGEIGGVLDQVLERLANTMEQQKNFRQKVKGAMLYPAIVVVAMFAVGLVMIFFVMPQISQMYVDFEADLPGMTKIILSVSNFIRTKWYLFILGIIGILGGGIFYTNSEEGKSNIDKYILQIPYLGKLQHKVISADIVKTLSLMIQSGVSIVESLNIVAEASSNRVYKKGMENASKNIEKGVTMAESFAKEEMFPEVIVQMVSVGEETGKLDEMLKKIGNQFTKDSLLALKSLTSAIEPAMIIILGIGVGIMMISIVMPIYNLTSSF